LVPSPSTAQLGQSKQHSTSSDVDQGINAALDRLHELVVLSQPFSKATAQVSTLESDPMDFDNKVAEGISHLDVSPNLFYKVDFSFLACCSQN
jgi:hypothetical protein